MPDQTDEEIVTAVQQGHKESFGLLIERYEQKMLRYAKKFLFDREDCRDVVQEIFIKAYINIQSFDPERRFSPWLYRIAHNEFINALKKKTRIKIFPLDLDTFLPHLVAPERTDSLAHTGELKKMLDRCLDKINSKYREPLIFFTTKSLITKKLLKF